MRKFIQRLRYKLPKYQYDAWYNSHVYDRKNYPVVFDKNGDYIECNVGLKVLMGLTECGENIYYEIIDYKSRYGDWIYPSDGIKCTLKFDSIKTKIN